MNHLLTFNESFFGKIVARQDPSIGPNHIFSNSNLKRDFVNNFVKNKEFILMNGLNNFGFKFLGKGL